MGVSEIFIFYRKGAVVILSGYIGIIDGQEYTIIFIFWTFLVETRPDAEAFMLILHSSKIWSTPLKKNESRRESRRESCIGSNPRLFGVKTLAKSPLCLGLFRIVWVWTLGETFRAKESRKESCRESRIRSYTWLPARLSPRLVFFTRDVRSILRMKSVN